MAIGKLLFKLFFLCCFFRSVSSDTPLICVHGYRLDKKIINEPLNIDCLLGTACLKVVDDASGTAVATCDDYNMCDEIVEGPITQETVFTKSTHFYNDITCCYKNRCNQLDQP
ncbi:hypothetical protein M3Y94_01316900 [Aphelenchoides besseyi]|nr:hypothetical protein M3Y94_01316900 [Aphelenchoides besseyi]